MITGGINSSKHTTLITFSHQTHLKAACVKNAVTDDTLRHIFTRAGRRRLGFDHPLARRLLARYPVAWR